MPNVKSVELLEQYLREVRKNLRGFSNRDASEIIQELRSHVLDRVDGDPSDATIEQALRSLGDPRDIARVNTTLRVAGDAADRNSPAVIARALFRLARLSLRGLFLLAVSLLGYSFAGVCVLTAIAKPFVPNRVGLWVLPDPGGDLSLTLGRLDPGAQGRDVLGWWTIPIGLAVGILVAFLTFRFHQRSIRNLARRSRVPEGSK
jgi:HAAS